jgi:hypothetical protein
MLKKRIIGLSAGVLATVVTATAAFGANATSSASLPTLAIAVSGKSITVPKTVPAGAVEVVTTAKKEASVGLVKLDPGVTVQKAFGLVNSHHGDPNALQGYASIVFSSDAPAGTSSTQTVLSAGNYAALNFAVNGQPSAQTFTVTPSSNSTALPKPAATVKMVDFAFTGPSKLHVGELVRIENDGYVVHMTDAPKFKNRADAMKAMAYLKAGNDKKAEKLATGFASFMSTSSPGAMQQEKISATPGVYVLACFMSTEDGREHTRLGMMKLITITK